ncbi:hypothetical protein [Microseira sp. BLCC-F43]|jgi:hypothetical protein|uniref:hypothetical protein n=1 Tax=Microseira sp. BLCC-F43 TaxID=3153602 RepID=UPI0035B7FE9A
MKRIIYMPIVLTLSLAILNCGSLLAERMLVAQLIEVRGRVELKKEGEQKYNRVNTSQPLYRGDLLRVQRGSRAVIRCTSNSTTWTVPDDGVPWGVTNTCSPRR